jgi:hypothetical protein
MSSSGRDVSDFGNSVGNSKGHFMIGSGLLPGALEGIRTPNLLIRSQMLYPLSYERRYCSILHFEPSRCVLETCPAPYSGGRASDFLIAIELRRTSAAAHPKLPPDPSKPWPAWVSIRVSPPGSS